MAKSTQGGMGALPFGGGVGFRRWAPFATSVWVAGTFNSWSTQAHPLEAEGDGYWSSDVSQARVGDEYKFVLTSPFRQGMFWKKDPGGFRSDGLPS
jgi:1,4-alpha-glucan branching enzyme